MKKFWKILGLGALAVGLTPYKVEKNEETGESSYQALLWRITSAPGQNGDKWGIDINLGEGTLTSKLIGSAEKAEESHLFSDELCVEYSGAEVENAEEGVEEAAEKAAEDAEAKEEAAEAAAQEAEEKEEAAEAAIQEAEEPKAEE